MDVIFRSTTDKYLIRVRKQGAGIDGCLEGVSWRGNG